MLLASVRLLTVTVLRDCRSPTLGDHRGRSVPPHEDRLARDALARPPGRPRALRGTRAPTDPTLVRSVVLDHGRLATRRPNLRDTGVADPGRDTDAAPHPLPAAPRPLSAAPPTLPAAQRSADRPGRRRGRRSRRCGCRGGECWRAGTARGELRACSLNIQSLKPKTVELRLELERMKWDIIFLQETWLSSRLSGRLLVFPGYTLTRADRPDGRGYGGVAILSRSEIQTKVLKPPEADDRESKLESLWCHIKWDRHQLVLASLYRPPRRTRSTLDSDFEELDRQLQFVLLNYPQCPIVIAGDLNCNLLDGRDSSGSDKLREFLDRYSFTQHVTCPTFTSGSLLDLVIANPGCDVSRTGVYHCDFSPHRFVRFVLSVPRPRHKPILAQSRCLRRIDVPALHVDLASADWWPVFASATVSDQWPSFLDVFTPIVDTHAPVRTVKIRNPTAPPVTDATRDLMSRRRAVLRADGHGSDAYKEANRAVRSAIRSDCRADIARRIGEQGPHTVWRNVRNHVAGKRPSQGTVPLVSASVMNDYFVGVGPRIAREAQQQGDEPDIPCRLPRVGACSFTVSPVDFQMLNTVIISMSSTSACGLDGICVRMLKLCLPVISPVLLHIVNSCLTRCDIPDEWKHSLVNPIHKSGDPSNPANFRPISIIPVISKVIERVVQRQLYNYLTTNHLLSDTQHGFRTRHSTETALVTISDRVLLANDQNQISLLCLLDLSKCFDVIDHSKLLLKLQQHGVDTAWFEAYLQKHTQSVSFTGVSGSRQISTALPNNMGVFQGSALGPLLYTIFSNDLSLFVPGATVVQYADDTQVMVCGNKTALSDLTERMEQALSSLDLWFRANSLKVNPDKTQLIVFGSRQNLRNVTPFGVKFRERTLQPVSEVKNLCVIFDRHLSWDAHVQEITRKCFGILIGLSHIRHYLPAEILPTIVAALVLSRVRYCLPVYGNGSRQNLNKIQKILNFAARVISGRRKFSRSADVRAALGWLDAEDLVKYHTLALLHKIRMHHTPVSISNSIQTNREARVRNTRQDDDLRLPSVRTEAGRRRFLYRGPMWYNALPVDTRTMSIGGFNRALQRILAADE